MRGSILMTHQKEGQTDPGIVTVEASTLPALQPDPNFAGIEYTS